MGFSYGIRILAEVSFILSQFTRLTDRRTDSHFAHECSTVKMWICFTETQCSFIIL